MRRLCLRIRRRVCCYFFLNSCKYYDLIKWVTVITYMNYKNTELNTKDSAVDSVSSLLSVPTSDKRSTAVGAQTTQSLAKTT